MKTSSKHPRSYSRILSNLAASAVVAGVLCFGIMPALAQNTSGVASAEEVTRIRNEIRQRDAQLGIRRPYEEVTREAIAIAGGQPAPAPVVAPTPAPEPAYNDYGRQSSRGSRADYRHDDYEFEPPRKGATFGVFAGPSLLYYAFDNENWDSATLYGGAIGFSVTFGEHHYLAIETGYYYTGSYDANENSPLAGDKIKVTSIPLSLTYNYVFNLNRSKTLKLRLGPTIGLTYAKVKDSCSYGPNNEYNDTDSYSDTSFGGGAIIGLRWESGDNLTRNFKWFFEISNRFMLSTEFDFSEGLKSGTIILDQTTVAVGVTF